MQMDTVIIKMNDTRIHMLMYKHTSTGRKTQLDQGVGGEKKTPRRRKKAWNGLYIHRAALDGGGNLMPCSLIHICVDLQTHEDETTALSRNVGNLIHV